MSQDFLNAGVRSKISEKIRETLNFDRPDQWNVELAEAVAHAILELYPNSVHTQSAYLTRLRNTLKAAGVSPEIIAKTRLPEVTTKHNVLGEAARKESALEGVNPPRPFHTVSALKGRVEQYVMRPPALTPQLAADFLVAFSARPSEALTLSPGPAGTVIGVLKKRDAKDEPFKLVSCLDQNLLKSFLTVWTRILLDSRRQLVDVDLVKQCKIWGITRNDLRKIGAWLAGLDQRNVASQMQVIQAATRHAPAKRPSADLNYAIVNEREPLQRLISALREEPDEELETIYRALVKRQRRSVMR